MAFQSRDLSVLAYANGFTLWHYTSTDPNTEIDAVGYFNDGADMLRTGDMIMANLNTGGASKSGVLLVNSVSGGVVGVAGLTQFASAAVR